MADNSNIVIRWEVDNAAAKFATGRVESEVFNKGGFKWIAVLSKINGQPIDLINLNLQCGVDRNGPWKCEVGMEMHVLRTTNNFYPFIEEDRFCYNEMNSGWERNTILYWSHFSNSTYVINDKVTIELRINIISSDGGQPRVESIVHPIMIIDPAMFDVPNRRSDVILKIGEKKLHVSKEFLAVHSPFFDTLFFGPFAENGKEEVEIKDVVYEEFLDLLHYIYLETADITDRTALHLLKLADQFEMKLLLKHSVTYLTQSKGIDVVKKLQMADQYNLTTVRDHCLDSFTSEAELKKKLKPYLVYDNFSDGMKVAICDRLMKF